MIEKNSLFITLQTISQKSKGEESIEYAVDCIRKHPEITPTAIGKT